MRSIDVVREVEAHLLRVFFTGAYRKPREVTWLIGVTMFALAMIEGFLGYSLPRRLCSAGRRQARRDDLALPARHPASFDYAGFNGRDLDDDVMDVMLSLATNSALGDGVAPDPARTGGEFPYFRAA